MASTYSTDLKLELMVTGENAGTWGTQTNTNLNLLQQSIAGVQGIDVSASDVTLVMSNAQLSNARNMVLVLNGSLTANRQVLIPNGIEKFYIIHDQTVRNGYSLTIKTVSGSGFAMETTSGASDMVACYSDGTDVYEVSLNTLSGSIAAAQLDSFAVTSTKLASFAVTSAKVASYAVTSNKLATNAVTAVKIANSTITLNKLSATGSPSASTYLRGDNTWGAISSSPTQLVSSIPLASGVSVTAGKVVSINSSGEIPAYPTLNTYGTTQANSTTTGYTQYSLDGSRALRVTLASTTLTFNGVVISNTGTPTNGATSVTATGSPAFGGGYVYPISNSAFIASYYWYQNFYTCEGQYSSTQVSPKTFIVTVDGSGNCTKGNEITSGNANVGSGLANYDFAKISNDIFILRILRSNSSVSPQRFIVTYSGTTVTGTSDADSADFWTANGENAQLTTNNIIGLGNGNSWITATWTASPVGIGTSSSTAPISDFLSGATWYMMKSRATANAEYALVTYTDTAGVAKYKTFSINQTTGALTLVETGNFTALVGFSGNIAFKDKDNLVAGNTAASYSFTNGVLNGTNSQGYSPGGYIVYNSGNLFYIFYTSLTNFPNNIGYTVNAYATSVVNYLGVVKTTTGTSPASIVTDGVATGFTSLTAGTLYYTVAPFTGEVTTSSVSGILVGKATSTTEILLQRSNTQ